MTDHGPERPAQFPFPDPNAPAQAPPPPAAPTSSAAPEASEAPDKLHELKTPSTRPRTKARHSSAAPARTRSKRPSVATRNSQRNQTWHARGLSARGRQHSSSNNTKHAERPHLDPSELTSLSISHKEFNTHASVSPNDGRLHISVNRLKDGPVTRRLFSTLNSHSSAEHSPENDAAVIADVVDEEKKKHPEDVTTAPPRLNIVIMVIGSRGDVQPFIAIAKVLKEQWGHRVRLATHGVFREFVEGHGIELFDIGGDPSELMAFMVKNPGLIPNVETIKAGEIARRREQMFEMFQGFWRACIQPNDRCKNRYMSADSSTGSISSVSSSHTTDPDDFEPFIADAIIANPPSFAHVHCAEKLGCPLHLMFTFPYSPTAEMPHPLAFIQNSNLSSDYTNAITYPMVEMMTWQGLGDLVNRFRQETLFLEPVATLWAPGMISRLKVPFTYMWSSALIPKPKDWGSHIDITGFVFLDQTKDYKPPDDLVKFLDDGEPPIYIGFGSIVVDDPAALTKIIFDAVKETGVRALVSAGWGGLGGDADVPDNVFMLDNVPHDWLFEKVSAVIHHGGAGTTAIGLFHGKPTMVVPFFGDQSFWGAMIENAGAGAAPVPHKELTTEKLVDGIRTLIKDEVKEKAQEISRKIREDDGDGAENAVRSFYRALRELDVKGVRGLGFRGMVHGEGGPMGPGEGKWGVGAPGIRCDVLPEKFAVWRVKKTRVRLSCFAASWAVNTGKVAWGDMRLLRQTEWNDFDGPGEPLSGGVSAFIGVLAGIAKGIIGVPKTLVRGAKRVPDEFMSSDSESSDSESDSDYSDTDSDSDDEHHRDEHKIENNKHENHNHANGSAAPKPKRSTKEKLKRGLHKLRPHHSNKLHGTHELPDSVRDATKKQDKEKKENDAQRKHDDEDARVGPGPLVQEPSHQGDGERETGAVSPVATRPDGGEPKPLGLDNNGSLPEKMTDGEKSGKRGGETANGDAKGAQDSNANSTKPNLPDGTKATDHAVKSTDHADTKSSDNTTNGTSNHATNGTSNHKPSNNRRNSSSSSWSSASSASSTPSRPPIPTELAHGTHSSIKKILRSIAHAPLDVSLAVAQGFHNAPRLYNDDTVRRPARITGFHSGARAAGKEFALGIYDGFSGLILQPYHGAKKEGLKGGLKGVGKGVGGLILKPQAGLAGVIGYGLKGVHREVVKGRDRKVMRWMERERRRQGDLELQGDQDGAWGKRCEDAWTSVEEQVLEKRGEKERSRKRVKGLVGREERMQRKEIRRRRHEREAMLSQPDPLVGAVSGKQRREMRRKVERGYTA